MKPSARNAIGWLVPLLLCLTASLDARAGDNIETAGDISQYV